ncbi:MAG: hypothetical protein HRT77_09975 [Halioglobus sp.]|nr:hypothetical protein [Halioglobus sp.]
MLHILLLLAGAFWYLSLGYTEMAGSDLWFHLAAGREILQTGSPWLLDSWSFPVSGRDWTNHEWLAAVMYYSWAMTFGLTSLVYWKWLVAVTTFCLLQWTLWQRTGGNGIGALLAACGAATVSAPFVDLRPHLYTLLGFSVLLTLCLQRTPARGPLIVLFVVWANLHGGVFFGLMALGILLFPWHDLRLQTLREALVTGVLCALAAAVNPHGLDTFLVPLEYAFDSSSPYRQLAEWRSPFDPGGIRSPLFFALMWAPAAASLYLLPAVRERTGIPWEGLALAALTLAMALTSRRFIPLFGMSLAVLITPLLAVLFDPIRQRALQWSFGLLFLVPGLLRLAPYPLQSAPAFHYLVAEYTYPSDLVDFMLLNGLHGNVYALYNWGGYLHWRSDGQLKVFMDGRANTVFDADTWHDYMRVSQSSPGWIGTMESTGADYFLWSNTRQDGAQKSRALTETGRWQLLYQDSTGWVAGRRDLALPIDLTKPPSSALRNLTLAIGSHAAGLPDKALHYVRQTRRTLPWQKTACQLELDLQRERGDPDAASAVMAECLGHFPSVYLR